MGNKYYHISFSYHETKSKGVLFGRCVLPLTVDPTAHEHLVALEQHIAKQFKLTRPVIHNWQLLREDEDNHTKSTSGTAVVEN
jgi:hypothetical protein